MTFRNCLGVDSYPAPNMLRFSFYFATPKALNCHDLIEFRSHSDSYREASQCRGDKPLMKQLIFPPSSDDSGYLSTNGSQNCFTADYSSSSHRARIATLSSGIPETNRKPQNLQRGNFKGGISEADFKPPNNFENEKNHLKSGNGTVYHEQSSSYRPAVQQKSYLHAAKDIKQSSKLDFIPENNSIVEKKAAGYGKSFYAVLIGNTVRVCNTKVYASLPVCDKYMIKERVPGTNRMRLSLKTTGNSSDKDEPKVLMLLQDDNPEIDGCGEKIYYHENCRSPGRIVFTCDKRFRGEIKYPLPSNKATDSKIGKGGNGFVFTLYHEKKRYAVKKTVYRSNEVNVYSALKHENILPLIAVLMGEKHEKHSGKFYCFHFMVRMDYDLRQILSTKEVGSLKRFYAQCSKDLERFKTAYNNVKYILKEALKALQYLHSNGYVHRDVKASNIMLRMKNCKGSPLHCTCSIKFEVKLGDFDSAGTVPGYGIREPTDQIIKFASILPLGTPGYRAPEVSMHITLSGPYETLYTTAVDMWSFGCLCLNACIGKTAALKQREEASLLLSKVHHCSDELWRKTTKIDELQKTKPFNDDNELLTLVQSCLQVDPNERPSPSKAQQYLVIQNYY